VPFNHQQPQKQRHQHHLVVLLFGGAWKDHKDEAIYAQLKVYEQIDK